MDGKGGSEIFLAVMEELIAWLSGPLPRSPSPTNQTSPGIWFQREIGLVSRFLPRTIGPPLVKLGQE